MLKNYMDFKSCSMSICDEQQVQKARREIKRALSSQNLILVGHGLHYSDRNDKHPIFASSKLFSIVVNLLHLCYVSH